MANERIEKLVEQAKANAEEQIAREKEHEVVAKPDYIEKLSVADMSGSTKEYYKVEIIADSIQKLIFTFAGNKGKSHKRHLMEYNQENVINKWRRQQ